MDEYEIIMLLIININIFILFLLNVENISSYYNRLFDKNTNHYICELTRRSVNN